MIFDPAHPGEVLRDYLGEMTVAEAAKRLGVTRAHLSRILNGHAGVSAAMSLRLSAALARCWQTSRATSPAPTTSVCLSLKSEKMLRATSTATGTAQMWRRSMSPALVQ